MSGITLVPTSMKAIPASTTRLPDKLCELGGFIGESRG